MGWRDDCSKWYDMSSFPVELCVRDLDSWTTRKHQFAGQRVIQHWGKIHRPAPSKRSWNTTASRYQGIHDMSSHLQNIPPQKKNWATLSIKGCIYFPLFFAHNISSIWNNTPTPPSHFRCLMFCLLFCHLPNRPRKVRPGALGRSLLTSYKERCR